MSSHDDPLSVVTAFVDVSSLLFSTFKSSSFVATLLALIFILSASSTATFSCNIGFIVSGVTTGISVVVAFEITFALLLPEEIFSSNASVGDGTAMAVPRGCNYGCNCGHGLDFSSIRYQTQYRLCRCSFPIPNHIVLRRISITITTSISSSFFF